VRAVEALRHRVPEGTPAEIADIADEAFGTIVAVMRGQVPSFMGHASAVLRASTYIREEVCGPVAQKLEHAGKDGEALAVTIVRKVSE
jgi:hypothetical protein